MPPPYDGCMLQVIHSKSLNSCIPPGMCDYLLHTSIRRKDDYHPLACMSDILITLEILVTVSVLMQVSRHFSVKGGTLVDSSI